MGWRSRYSPMVINPSSAFTAAVVDPVGFILPTPPRSKWSMLASWSARSWCRLPMAKTLPPTTKHLVTPIPSRIGRPSSEICQGQKQVLATGRQTGQALSAPALGQIAGRLDTRSDVKAMLSSTDAPILANQTLAAASSIFSWALKEEFAGVKVNPCVGVERNKTTSRERVLSDSELPRFWSAFDDAGLIRSMALKMTRTGHGHSRTSTHNRAIEPFNFPEYGGHLEQRACRTATGSNSGGGCCGSCRLIGIDEEGTLAQLKALRKTFFDPKIAEHHGRVVKNTGDGALVEFASVVDAARYRRRLSKTVLAA